MNKDSINNPSHYAHSAVEVIDAIEAWGLGFRLANAVKYVARCMFKGSKKEDLKKAIWYLDRELKQEHDTRAPMPLAHDCRNWQKKMFGGRETPDGIVAKLKEETDELRVAWALRAGSEAIALEIGDVLHMLIALADTEGLDIVECLHKAHKKNLARKDWSQNEDGSFSHVRREDEDEDGREYCKIHAGKRKAYVENSDGGYDEIDSWSELSVGDIFSAEDLDGRWRVEEGPTVGPDGVIGVYCTEAE